jgi:hypothetical protein
VLAGGMLAVLAVVSRASAVAGDAQMCSPRNNGGSLVKGVCVLPALNVRRNSEEFL